MTASYHPEAKGETVAISIKSAGKEMKIPKEFLFHEKRIHLRSIRILTTTLTGAPLGKDHLLWAGFCDFVRLWKVSHPLEEGQEDRGPRASPV